MPTIQVLEGQWEDILTRNGAGLAGRHVKIYVEADEGEDTFYSLDAAITRLNSRTAENITVARKRLLDAASEPTPLPPGKTLEDVIMGQWSGNETDDEINAMLRKLS